MSLLLDTDVELSTEPPLHPLAPDSSAFDAFNAFGGDSTRGLLADRLSGGSVPNKPPMPTIDSPEGEKRSAFRAVGGNQGGGSGIVNSPAVKPAPIPFMHTRSPQVSRRLDSSDQETVSPTPSSTASESQPATPAASALGPFSWPAHSEENRELLGTEEESTDRSDDEAEEEKNIWLITREQMSYYMTQFHSMQPNPQGVIPGTQAKEFFEKSRLPIQELRKIWQLSDVTKDGCLSLEEFLTAMHLVVLRRNDISLPDSLPPCLTPLSIKTKVVDLHNKDLYQDGNQRALLETEDLVDGEFPAAVSSGQPVLVDTDSAVSPESLLSSPGRPKPVSFDFNAKDASQDPSIACPVPLRLSPDSPVLETSEDERTPQTIGRQPLSKGKGEVVYEQLWNQEESLNRRRRTSSASSSSSSSSNEDTEGEDAAHLSSSPHARNPGGPLSLPYLQAAESTSAVRGVLSLQKKEGAPPSPPPRPGKTHARSSSLDLAQLNKRAGVHPPFLPPRRTSPGRRTSDSTEDMESSSRDNKNILANIHKYKESVALLNRTVAELGQEVADIMEERVVLEYQLEQLKSIGSQD